MMNSIHIPKFNKLCTSEESRESDHKTIKEFGIDGFTLMEIAASGAAKSMGEILGKTKSGLFLCGKGNNGGDAIAAARYLNQNFGHYVKLVFVLGSSNLSPDSQKNLDLIRKLQIHEPGIEVSDKLSELSTKSFDYIVDGILGTGLNSDIREPVAGVIKTVNSSGLPVFSMDVPTGLNADTGIVMGKCIKANYTFTFGTNKIGFYLNSSQNYTGHIELIPLPFPRYLEKFSAALVNDQLDCEILPADRTAKHKYEQGVIHILAGSEGLTGAAIMAAQSAWKKGAGAVILYSPKKLLPIYEKNLPQIIKVAVGDDEDSHFKTAHIDKIKSSTTKKPGVLLIGPGTGTADETKDCIFELLKHHNDEAVIDADALSDFHRLKSLPVEKRQKWILTPHIGEAKNYLNLKFEDDCSRLTAAIDFVKHHQCAILVKGNPTIFINKKGEQYITGYDTSMFTRAGFGDILSGTIAANLGITKEVTQSATDALNSGFKKYKQHSDREVFGPEHLL